MKSTDAKPEQSRARKVRKPEPDQINQATGAEFEREGMGIAPKE